MLQQNQTKNESVTTLVYSVVRFGQLHACYAKIEDALQMQKVLIEKGQIADLVVKPLL